MACVLTENEALYIPAGLDSMLNHLGRTRDQAMEEYYDRVLTPHIVPEGTDPSLLANVQNFVNYGTFSTLRLGQGERAGVVNSYREAYGHLPITECDWQNVIKIANTKLPTDRLTAREQGLVSTFQKIYGRAPNDVLMDRIAHMVMAYGVRPQSRDLRAEWQASKVHLKLFGKLPSTASEWDINRAIAYSGLPQSLLAADLSNATGRIYAFLTDGASLSLK